MNIIDIIDDPRFFKPLFRDERSWRAWRVFLKALFGIPITDKAESDERQVLFPFGDNYFSRSRAYAFPT
jgi:hypothetical protein